jgi:hypothetical protein
MKPAARFAAPAAVLALLLMAAACGGSGGPSGNGANLLENPGAEQNADGYVGHGGATVSQDTTTAGEGAASVKVIIPDAQGAGVQLWKADGVTMTAVSAGSEYELSADVKGDAGKTARLEILWHSAAGAFLVTTLGEVFFLPVDGFQRFTLTAEAPEGAGLAVPQIVTDVAPGGPLTVWVDDVRFVQTSGSDTPAPSPSP